jgi:glycerophosphoryl diester phosphodiesterase
MINEEPAKLKRPFRIIPVAVFIVLLMVSGALAFSLPAAGWHRGDISVAQENSKKAFLTALRSTSPNLEFDLIDFKDEKGNRVGLVVHDYDTKRITGTEGKFNRFQRLSDLPGNAANPALPQEPLMTVVDVFEMIKQIKSEGITPTVSLDLKEQGDSGEAFGRWIGTMIQSYGFQDHVFASSFYKSNVAFLRETCPACLVGGLVFNDHWALKHLNHHYTSLDLTGLSKATFFLGFLGKEDFKHDFVLIQDDIFFQEPQLADYWRNVRKVKFVGIYVYEKERPYTEAEWTLLKKVDWMELDPPQMHQYLLQRRQGR